jgi:hypothetical protein
MMLMKEGPSDEGPSDEGPSDEGPRGSRHVMRWRCYGVDMCQWSGGWCRRVLVWTCHGLDVIDREEVQRTGYQI